MSMHIGTGYPRDRRLLSGLLALLVGVGIVAPASPAQAFPEPAPLVGPLQELDIKANKALKVKIGLCQGEIYYGWGWLQTRASFTPKAGCRSHAIQYWYLSNDNSLYWSPEDTGKNRDIVASSWYSTPEQVVRVVVTVVDSTGVSGRVWANTPAL